MKKILFKSLLLFVPETSLEKQAGLLNYATLPKGYGMLFLDVNAIHTIGMHFPIKVTFLDANYNEISSTIAKPGLKLVINKKAKHIIETMA